MRLPRRPVAENDFDTEREANLLGHDDGSALAAFFVDLRCRVGEAPEVAPSAEVLTYLRSAPLGDDRDASPSTLASPSLDAEAPVHGLPCEVWERPSRWLAAAAIALIAGGGAIWWSTGLAAGPSSSSVSAGQASTVFGHDADEAARATLDLGSAGAVTVDRAGRRPLLTNVRPGDGWQLTGQREDGTQLTLSSNDRETLTVTIVIDDPLLWIEVTSTQSSEVTRLLLANEDQQLNDDDDGPASAAAENAPAAPTVPEPAGAQSGVPVTGVAPRGGVPSSGLTTTPRHGSVTTPQTEPATTESSTPAPGPLSPTTTSAVSTTPTSDPTTSSSTSTSTTTVGSGDDDGGDDGDDGSD